MEVSFIEYIESSIKKNWDKPALSDYKSSAANFKDVARKIEKLHILFQTAGINRGDKIAICGRNSSHWGISFLATLTYGAVAVPILHEFKPDNVHHIVNHSNAKILIIGDIVWENLDDSCMPDLIAVLRIEDYSLRLSRDKKINDVRARLNEMFGCKYPERFTPDDISYDYNKMDDIALINYTSGTTSSSKGVVLPYRSLWANLQFAIDHLGIHPDERVVAMLPMAHMYGLAFEFIYQFVNGSHIYFLTRTPSPKLISEAFKEVKPSLIIAVPLIIEKIVKKRIFPKIEKPAIKLLMSLPVVNTKIKDSILKQVISAFGGDVKQLIIGGSALNKEVEDFLHRIKFPYTVGYGMTECGPLISYASPETFVKNSCGRPIERLSLKINSLDPKNIVGEIMVKGYPVMKEYYKNEEATKTAIDDEGWLRTGDLGVIDEQGNLFIRGRSKNMILGPSGQNIYPEEIEDKLNNLPYINESIVIDSDGKIVALVYPDFEMMQEDNIGDSAVNEIMTKNLKILNETLPTYSQVARIKIYNEEFEKTPKRSIKRFLYQNAVK